MLHLEKYARGLDNFLGCGVNEESMRFGAPESTATRIHTQFSYARKIFEFFSASIFLPIQVSMHFRTGTKVLLLTQYLFCFRAAKAQAEVSRPIDDYIGIALGQGALVDELLNFLAECA